MPSSSERVVAALGKDHVIALDDLFDRMTRDPLHERFAGIDDVLSALYASFPAALVGTRGTLLLSESDAHGPRPEVADASTDGAAAPPEVTAITKASAEVQ